MALGVWQAANLSTGYVDAIVGGILLFILIVIWGWHWSVRHESHIKIRWKRVLEQPGAAVARPRYARQLAFIRARLSPHGYFGLQMTIGALVLIAASWLFGGVSEDVLTGDPLTVVDQVLADWFQAHAVPLVTQFMVVVSNLHGVVAISSYAVLFALYLLWRRDWVWLVCLATTVPGGMLLNVLTKHAFQRARPIAVDPLLALSTYSYPSGHVAGTALFYGVLGSMLIARTDVWQWRVLIAFTAITLVLLVALSRMVLGVHFLSDVIAAFAEAVAWLSICLMGSHTWWKHRTEAQRETNPNVC